MSISLNQKKILVTGGTGFLGQYLVKRLLQQGCSVSVLGRSEESLRQLKKDFPAITIYVAALTNKDILEEAAQGAYGVFHLAAFKHVRLAEETTVECIQSNILGSLNLLEICSSIPSIHFILAISTDKACQVNGVYGATKFIMEKLFAEYERNNPHILYRLVRLGNIVYSTGSVLCKWRDLLSEGKPILVTDENVTRFYWTPEKAIDLLFECLEKAPNSKPYIPFVKAMRLKDILEVMVRKYHPTDKQPQITYIGLQKGENMHEKLEESGLFSNQVPLYTQDEIYEMV